MPSPPAEFWSERLLGFAKQLSEGAAQGDLELHLEATRFPPVGKRSAYRTETATVAVTERVSVRIADRNWPREGAGQRLVRTEPRAGSRTRQIALERRALFPEHPQRRIKPHRHSIGRRSRFSPRQSIAAGSGASIVAGKDEKTEGPFGPSVFSSQPLRLSLSRQAN